MKIFPITLLSRSEDYYAMGSVAYTKPVAKQCKIRGGNFLKYLYRSPIMQICKRFQPGSKCKDGQGGPDEKRYNWEVFPATDE